MELVSESQLADAGAFHEALVNLGFRSDERFCFFIVGLDEGVDVLAEVGDGVEVSTVQRLSLQDLEPDLHLIEPRTSRVGRILRGNRALRATHRHLAWSQRLRAIYAKLNTRELYSRLRSVDIIGRLLVSRSGKLHRISSAIRLSPSDETQMRIRSHQGRRRLHSRCCDEISRQDDDGRQARRRQVC
jgi:hypothetical protein